jgi:endonuclease/exonuclease/phosphatase family metal-dependent hydrolase
LVRVLTLNVWARHGNWPARRAVLREGLRALEPDLLFLQETVVTGDDDQVSDVLGDGYRRWHLGGREADGTGLSIASRWPLAAREERDLLVTSRVDPRELAARVAVARVDVPGAGEVLLVHHKPTFRLGFEHERELQAVRSARFVAELAGSRPVVLAGDFDAVPDTASIRFWHGAQSLDGVSVCYQDAWDTVRGGEPGYTFTPDNPLVGAGNWPLVAPRRIDYVMVGCGGTGPRLRIADCFLAFDRPVDGVWASDHFGVVADLEPLPVEP